MVNMLLLILYGWNFYNSKRIRTFEATNGLTPVELLCPVAHAYITKWKNIINKPLKYIL